LGFCLRRRFFHPGVAGDAGGADNRGAMVAHALGPMATFAGLDEVLTAPAHEVCAESQSELMTGWNRLSWKDRAASLRSGRVGFVIQVEVAAWGWEGGASRSVDCLETQAV
jgi:hypothetical protein